jgi:subtilisin family serine protease
MTMREMPSATMQSDAGENAATDGQIEMPRGQMDDQDTGGANDTGGMPSPQMDEETGTDRAGGEKVLVEMRVPGDQETQSLAQASTLPGLTVDDEFEPIPMRGDESAATHDAAAGGEPTTVIRATLDPARRAELEADPRVVKVWSDGKIAPFDDVSLKARSDGAPGGLAPAFDVIEGMATCPIGTCDCAPGTPKGGMADVRAYLGVDHIWGAGIRGDDIIVGIVDGGIRADGRPTSESGPKLGRVIGGFPSNWGTRAGAWNDHGMMCGTDVLGMAPNAQLYDLRISDGDALSTALAAFQWAINRHRQDGTPHILSNSWGMFQEAWAPDYTTNPNHPFTRKVLEAIDEGIIVLFAAGNCGGTCPDGRCGGDSGPGRSIWGANGHQRVITVGAVNRNEQFVGYSSQGPAALHADKPDFCSITHFTGYFNSDSGTSAATPIAAGVVALLKQRKPSLTQVRAQNLLKSTAKDIGPRGFDRHSGAGIIRAKAAFDALAPAAWRGWERLGGFCTDGVGVSSWGTDRLDCFVVGNDRSLWHKWYAGGWSGWEDLGGRIYSNPAAVSWGSNRIDAFALGGDRAMWHRWWDGSAWRGWESLGGFCTDGVGVSSWGPGRLDCFVVGNDRSLWHKWYSGGWSGWENLGGRIYSNPAAVSWGPNRIDVFAIGGDHAMWHRWWDGSAWRGWESLGGFCTNGVGVSSWAPGRLDCFVVGNDRSLWHKWYDGGWSGWENLGGKIYSNPAAVSWGQNRIDVFAIGGDHAMWHRWYD